MSRVDDLVIIDDIHWFITYKCRVIHTWWFTSDIPRPMSFIPVYMIIDSVVFIDWIFIDDILWLTHCQWSHLAIHDIEWGMSRVDEQTFICDQSVNVINENHVVNDDILVNPTCQWWHIGESSKKWRWTKNVTCEWHIGRHDVERRVSRVNEPTFICDQSKNILDEYSINEYYAVNDHIYWNEWHEAKNVIHVLSMNDACHCEARPGGQG